MKCMKYLLSIVLVVSLFPVFQGAPNPETAFADTATTIKGQESEVQGQIVEKKGKSYYKTDKGDKVANVFITQGKKTYFFDKAGVMAKGWAKIGGAYYCFDRTSGVMKKSQPGNQVVVDGIKVGKDGKAKENDYAVSKIKTMMKARQIMLANTKHTDSKADKRLKMFRWVQKGYYKRFRTLKSTGYHKGWELQFANDMFKNTKMRYGCCVSNACAFAFLAKECGYDNVEVCDDTGHAFVRINGKYFDTLFAEVDGMSSYYNSTKSQARKDFPVNSLKI